MVSGLSVAFRLLSCTAHSCDFWAREYVNGTSSVKNRSMAKAAPLTLQREMEKQDRIAWLTRGAIHILDALN